LSTGGSGQKQNQSTSFTTGEWSEPPELFRTRENLVLRVEGKNGVQFVGINGDQIESMRSERKLEISEKLTLKESKENIARMKADEADGTHEADGTDELTVAFHQDTNPNINRGTECRAIPGFGRSTMDHHRGRGDGGR
jgi:hypothetical protein